MTDRERYRNQMDSLSFSPDFEERTAERMRRTAEEKENNTMKNRKTIKILIAAAAAVIMLTSTVFAVSALLSPKEVAEHIGDRTGNNSIAQAFEDKDAVSINQTITAGGYDFTLLGIASGERIDYLNDLPVETQSSYVVLAVSRTDGTPIAPEDGIVDAAGRNLAFSPLVEGWAPHRVNAWSLNCHGSGITVDGVRYYLFDYSNLELFADRTVYLAVYEGLAPSIEKFVMDQTGAIHYAEGYEGIKVMFTLPIDSSRADREAAERLLAGQNILPDEEVFAEPTDTVEQADAEGETIIVELDGSQIGTHFHVDGDGASVYFEAEVVNEATGELRTVTTTGTDGENNIVPTTVAAE